MANKLLWRMLRCFEFREMINMQQYSTHSHQSKHTPAVADMLENQALKLLYDKNLLSTLNKAISDTAKSCFSYIHSKSSSTEESIQNLNRFSGDFIEVLASIINQTKSNYIRHKFGEQSWSDRSLGLTQIAQNYHSSAWRKDKMSSYQSLRVSTDNIFTPINGNKKIDLTKDENESAINMSPRKTWRLNDTHQKIT